MIRQEAVAGALQAVADREPGMAQAGAERVGSGRRRVDLQINRPHPARVYDYLPRRQGQLRGRQGGGRGA